MATRAKKLRCKNKSCPGMRSQSAFTYATSKEKEKLQTNRTVHINAAAAFRFFFRSLSLVASRVRRLRIGAELVSLQVVAQRKVKKPGSSLGFRVSSLKDFRDTSQVAR
jgi:hypothetical protein